MAVISVNAKDGKKINFKISGDSPNLKETTRINEFLFEYNNRNNPTTRNIKKQTEKDFDTQTGIRRFGLRAALAGAEKKEEEENILRKTYGLDDEDFTRDNRGRIAITKSGGDKLGLNLDKTTLVDEEGFSRYDFSADLAGLAPELAGGVGGSLLGAAAGTAILPGLGTLIGGALGGGFGAAGGQAAEEAIETATGIQEQTLGEVGKDLGTEFLLGSLGELAVGGAIKILAPFARGLKGKPLDDETLKVAYDSMEEFGIDPTIGAIGGSSLIARQQKIIEKVLGGSKRLAKNFKNLTNKINEYKSLSTGGREISEITDEEVGEILKRTLLDEDKALKEAEKKARQGVLDTFQDFATDLGAKAATDNDLDNAVFGVLSKAIKGFNDLSTDKFASIDAILKSPAGGVGDEAIINTGALKEIAKKLEQRNKAARASIGLSPTRQSEAAAVDAVVAGFKALPKDASFTQLYNLRRELFDASFSFGGRGGGEQLKDAFLQIDSLLSPENMMRSINRKGVSLSNEQAALLQKAADEIPDARDFFKKGREAIEDMQDAIGIRNLHEIVTKNQSIPPDVTFLDRIVKPKKPEPLKRTLDFVKRELGADEANILRERLAGQYLKNALDKTQFKADDVNSFKGANFSQAIDRLGDNTGKLLFGDNFDQVKSLADQIRQTTIPGQTGVIDVQRALDGAIASQAPDALVNTLKEIQSAQAAKNTFQNNNIISKITRNESIGADEAASYFATAGKASDIEEVMKRLDDEGKNAVRGLYMKNLLDDFGPDVLIRGEQLKAMAKSFNRAAEGGKLKSIFGEEMGSEMERFGKVLELNTKTADGGDLIAANIAAAPLENIANLVRFAVVGRLFTHAPTYKAVLKDYDARIKGVTPSQRSKILGDAIGSALVQFTVQQGQEGARETAQQVTAGLESAGVDLGAINDQLSAIRSPAPNTGIGQVDVLQPQQSSIRQRAAENPQVANALGITGATQGLL
jgi:hypothetical protein